MVYNGTPAERHQIANHMLFKFTDGSLEDYENEPFAQGGQGTLYLSTDNKHVVKLYHASADPKARENRTKALTEIIGKLNVTRINSATANLFAWPNGIVTAPRLGVRMDNVNATVIHKPLTWWIMPRASKRLAPDIRGNWLDRVYVAVNMARIAWQLHSYGLAHSDFSGDNFLANVAKQHVVLIDLDSLVVPGVLPPEMLGTGEYMAPEIVIGRMKGDSTIRPSIETDRHALAVLIYQLLLMRHPLKGPKQHDSDPEKDDLMMFGQKALYTEDPDDRSNRPADPFRGAWLLGDEVEGMMREAFTVGLRNPTRRPVAAEWGDALMRMADQVIPCANEACEGKAFVLLRDKPAVCPWCGTPVKRPGQVPILRLYYDGGQAGHYQSDKGRVIGWPGRTLHRWHTYTGADYAERNSISTDERRALAEFTFGANGWQLTNNAIPDLKVAGGGSVQTIGLKESIRLENGQLLILGSNKAARLASVSMQGL
jgi:DNA-binding helix-hairpin-helix protein with protein kinase domain